MCLLETELALEESISSCKSQKYLLASTPYENIALKGVLKANNNLPLLGLEFSLFCFVFKL